MLLSRERRVAAFQQQPEETLQQLFLLRSGGEVGSLIKSQQGGHGKAPAKELVSIRTYIYQLPAVIARNIVIGRFPVIGRLVELDGD
jgi:hypothetical protein